MNYQDIPRAPDESASDIPAAVISLSEPPAGPDAQDQADAAAATAALISKAGQCTALVDSQKDAIPDSEPLPKPPRIQSPAIRARGSVTYSHRGVRHVATYEVAGLTMTLSCGLGTFKVPSGQGNMQKFARTLLMSICKRAHRGKVR